MAMRIVGRPIPTPTPMAILSDEERPSCEDEGLPVGGDVPVSVSVGLEGEEEGLLGVEFNLVLVFVLVDAVVVRAGPVIVRRGST